jgi:reactive intermediate/imine deaminase
MTTRTNSEGAIPRRKVLSDSARLLAATAAASSLATTTPASAATPPAQHLNPPTVSTTRGYSHAVVVSGGKTVYISGQISLDRTGKLVGEGNLQAQAQQVFENLKAVLEAAGATFADVVKLTIYMLDASQVQVVRDVRDTFIKADAPPASTLVEVKRLVRQEFLLEIDAIAHVGA